MHNADPQSAQHMHAMLQARLALALYIQMMHTRLRLGAAMRLCVQRRAQLGWQSDTMLLHFTPEKLSHLLPAGLPDRLPAPTP
jgi:hypothetical protein